MSFVLSAGSAAFAATCTVTSTADTNTTGTLRSCAANAAAGDTIDLSTLPALSIITLGSELDVINPVTVHGRLDGGVTIYGTGGAVFIRNTASAGTYTYDHLVLHSVELLQGNGAALAVSYSTLYGVTGNFPAINGTGADTITHSSVVNNPAGGVNSLGAITVIESTVYGNGTYDLNAPNPAISVTITRSIVGVVQALGPSPTYTNSYHGSAPQLGPLQLNGSLFPTMLPLVGSPVIGIAGSTAADERGYAGKTAGDAGAVQTHYITVTAADTATGSGGDLVPTDTTSGSCSTTSTTAACTLRQAINYANTNSAVGTDITFAPALTATATTAAPAVITLGASLPNIASPIDLAGPGANLLQISGAGAYRIATIAQTTGSLAFNGLTATRGAFSGGIGGAFLNQGTLTLEASSVTASTANDGGGIYDDATSSILYLHDSTLSGNTATNGSGGGLYHEGVADVLLDSTISGNTAFNDGGGAVIQSDGNADSTVAGVGRLVGVTISNNSVGNTFSNLGGGVFTYGSPSIANSVIEGNTGGPDPDLRGGYTDGGGNLINTSPNATSPGLGPLAYNGGTTQTLLPLPGSAAICTGTAANGLTYGTTTDQRGATHSTTYCTTAQLDAGAVQTSYSGINFVQQPSDVLVNHPITPSPTVVVTENGVNALNIPVPLVASVGGETFTAGNTGSTGVATFTNVAPTVVESTEHLVAELYVIPSAANSVTGFLADSSSFRVLGTADHTTINANAGPAPAGQSNPGLVTVLDTTNGNASPVGTVTVVNATTGTTVGWAAYSGTPVSFDFASSTSGTNNFTISFTPNAGGAYAASSISYPVVVGAVPSAANSTLTAAPATLPQGAVSTVTATLLDANKNPIANTAVTFNESSTLCTSGNGVTQCNTANVMQSATTNMNGVAQVSLSAVQGANPVTVTATASGVTFNQVATVNFVAPAYVVTVATDTTTGVAANCVDPNVSATGNTTCSLRDAVAASNALTGVTTAITFAPALTAGGAQTLTLGGTDLVVTGSVNISGPGARLLTISGNNASRILTFPNSVAESVSGLTLTKGNGVSSTSSNSGGAIYSQANLTLTDTLVSANTLGTNSFNNVTGAGVCVQSGSLTTLRTTFTGNTTAAFQAQGGAIFGNTNTSINLTDSTITGNILSGQDSNGAGISANASILLVDTTIAGNSTPQGDVGGIYGVSSTTLSATNSIIAGNSASFAADTDLPVTGSGNLIGSGTSGSSSINPLLGPLAYYSATATTPELLPLPGSPAICNGVTNTNGPALDQRGAATAQVYGNTGCIDSGSVQTHYALAFTTQPPASVVQATNFTAGVTLTEDAQPFTAAAETLPLTLTPANGTLTGGSASTSTTTGTAAYGALQVANAGTGDTLTASLTLTGTSAVAATSTAFTVTAAAPTVTSISPAYGTQAGGTAVTISGTNLSTVTSVTFGGPSVAFTVQNGTLTVTSPAHNGAGAVTVIVTNSAGTVSTTFTYLAPPTVLETFTPTTINTNATSSLQFSIGNPSTNPVTLTGIAFADVLPSGLTIATGTTATSTCTTGTVTINSPSSVAISGIALPSGGTCTVSLTVTSAIASSYTNTTSAPTSSLTTSGNAASATITVQAVATKLAFAAAPATPITAGGNAGSVAVTEQDASGNVVANASDTITLMVTGPGNYSQTYTAKATNGIATFPLTTPALTTAGAYTYTATFGTLTQAIAPETVTPAAASKVAVSSGSGQSAAFSTAFAQPLVVTVTDQYGNAVASGTTVTFTGPASGAGITPGTGTAITGTNGTASFTPMSNALGGSYTVTATVSGGTTSASFTLTNATATPGVTVTAATIAYGSTPTTLSATVTYTGTVAPSVVSFSIDGGTAVTATCSTKGSPETCTASVATGTLTVPVHTITAAVAADTNYKATSSTGTLTVTKTTPSIVVMNTSISAGTATTTLSATLSFSGAVPTGGFSFTVDNGTPVTATCSGTTTPQTCTASYATARLATGPRTITASSGADMNYNASSGTGTLTVNTIAPSVNVSAVTMAYATATTTLTATVSYTAFTAPTGAFNFQVDAGQTVQATCSGATSPRTCTASYPTATLTAGSHTITGTQTADTTYTQANGTAQLTLTTIAPAIAFTVANRTYGDAPFTVTATSNSTGSFTYSVVSGPATISGNTVTLTGVGSVVLQVNEAADTNYTTGSAQTTFSVTQAQLAVTANNSTRLYGAANPAFTGTVTGQQYGNTFTEGFATAATTLSPVAAYAIVPTVTGAALADYTVATTNGTLTVTQAPTLTSLSASASSINPNQTVTLTAVAASTTSGTPTGTVTFYDNGVALSTITLTATGSMATYTTALSASTTHTLTATYSGDTNFLGSMGVAGVVTVAAQDFTFTDTASPAYTVSPGKTASFTFSVSPDFGTYAGAVTFTVTGLPPGAVATFTPATIAANGGTQSVVLNVKTPAAIAANTRPGSPFERGTAVFALLLLPAFGNRKLRKALGARLMLAVLLFGGLGAAATLTGCGTGTGFQLQQPATYTLVVTATSGSLVHTQTVTLTVQ